MRLVSYRIHRMTIEGPQLGYLQVQACESARMEGEEVLSHFSISRP